MGEPYTIRILVPDGDPEGAKIIELLNWTGVGIAFPRSCWPQLRGRDEFKRSGIYVLTGPTEGTDDELPTVYVGQGDGIGARIEAHHAEKDFWDWCFAFVSKRACGKLGVWGQAASCLRAASVSGRLVSRLSMTSIILTWIRASLVSDQYS